MPEFGTQALACQWQRKRRVPVKGRKLSAYNWATVVPYLAGDQFHFQDSIADTTQDTVLNDNGKSRHVTSANQNFSTAPTPETLTIDRLAQQGALIDALTAETKDPTALRFLQQSKALVQRRLSQVAAAPGH